MGQCSNPPVAEGGTGLGRDRPRADSDVRWRALGRARARLVVEASDTVQSSEASLGLEDQSSLGRRCSRGPETAGEWVVLRSAHGVLTAREPQGTGP